MDMAFPESFAFDSRQGDLAMRPLGWSELCARLMAAQQLRRLQSGACHRSSGTSEALAPVGSFHRVAANMLDRSESPKDFINSTSSAYRKGNQGTSVDSRENPLIVRSVRQADENCDD